MKLFLKGILGLGIIVFILAGFVETSPPPSIDPIGKYLNGKLPSTGSSDWELIQPYPDLQTPLPVRVIPFDDEKILILSKLGKVLTYDSKRNESNLILDISEKVMSFNDGGMVGVALHPQWGNPAYPDKQQIFLYYRTCPTPDVETDEGFNTLSKFIWDSDLGKFDKNSEEVLISQYDRKMWHDAGSMFFGRDGFLYFGIGDEGLQEEKELSTQRIDGGFFSGIFRIDVDMDPTRSHPIRRQPQGLAAVPDGWEDKTMSRGYYIPDDNPFQDENGGVLEEYYALGVRSPFTMQEDPSSNEIWVADVGSDQYEEINKFQKGDNLQWPYMEGKQYNWRYEKPDSLIGKDRPPYYEYERPVGTAVIGAGVYTSSKYPSLYGSYIFADYSLNKIMALRTDPSTGKLFHRVLHSGIDNKKFNVPVKIHITGMSILEDGRIFINAFTNGSRTEGEILELVPAEASKEPPYKLSELEIFKNMSSLEPIDGIIPYDVNTPLWSDGAIKKRWIALPSDGMIDSPDEKITFSNEDPWTFPKGTVFIKHFELPVSDKNPEQTVRLETRFVVITEDSSAYGITYRWNDEGTDAFLLDGAEKRDIPVEENGSIRIQTWDYPSRTQCLDCHTQASGRVLGFTTQQINRKIHYPSLSDDMNQLQFLRSHNFFSEAVSSPENYPASASIEDESETLEYRVRSYLDANCSYCHRPGHLSETDLDFRLKSTDSLKYRLRIPTMSHASNTNLKVVTWGEPDQSEIWIRDGSTTSNKMPPIGRNLVDDEYMDVLTRWIKSLVPQVPTGERTLIYPNPSDNETTILISDDLNLPLMLSIYDTSGKLIRRADINTYRYKLDMSNMSSGVYLMVASDGNTVVKDKIMKH